MIEKHAYLFSTGVGQLTEFKDSCAARISDGEGEKPLNQILIRMGTDAVDQLRRAYIYSEVGVTTIDGVRVPSDEGPGARNFGAGSDVEGPPRSEGDLV